MPTKNRGTLVPRNPVARSPLLHKGGVHEKSKTSQRGQQRAAINAQLEDWREDLEFERSLRSNFEALLLDIKLRTDHAFSRSQNNALHSMIAR